jgi:PHD/YefM family antitoxin component YafN of YafNO toxin-antitoxin module
MTTYTYSEARQNFSSVLEKAKEEGEVLIIRKDGSSFILRPFDKTKSPLAVDGIDLDLTSEEIIDILREVREQK